MLLLLLLALSRTLVKEVSPFNIRVLTVQPGTFNTNMFNATILGRNALPDDYRGSVAEQTMRGLASGAFQADGDKDKAMRAVYELVVGEGVGAGRESERLLPLGRDLVARLKGVQEYYAHALEVFGDVCNNVYRDGR
jgi:NAD(P)-dependent dehydrogenase (short-subunit alcohol dehydrogenase family)